MTWPLRTTELKSAPSHDTVPDTWVPTCTVVTACTVPVADTLSTIGPWLTSAVEIAGRGVGASGVVGAGADADRDHEEDCQDDAFHVRGS